MSAPVGYTCPKIDKVITELDEAADVLSKLAGRTGLLEEIRDANAKLREWGEGLEEQIEAIKTELDAARDRIAELEAELRDALAEAA